MKAKVLILDLCVVSTVILFTACGRQHGGWQGTIEKVDGVNVVRNNLEPIYKEDVFIAEEELSIGDDEKNENYAFSEVSHITADNEGRIYVLDRKESHVKVFDRDGKYVRTIGRKGQGPGELNDPIFVYFPGNELLVTQYERLSFFSPEGKLQRAVLMKKERPSRARRNSRGNMIGTSVVFDPGTPGLYYEVLKMYDSEMEPIKELARIQVQRRPGVFNPFSANVYMTVDDEDRIIFGYSREYEIQIYSPAGDLATRIIKEYMPVEITEKEKAESTTDIPPQIKVEFPRYHPPFLRFVHDEGGRIYVQTYERGQGLNVYYHDVFDREGRFIAKVQLRPTPVVFRKGKLYSLEENEGGYQVIKRYKITWNIAK
jgi:hypothetical protein